MIHSLSQIESQAQKAVRGAGFGWGHAQEAGKAVRWLATHQLPGAVFLAKYLGHYQKNPNQYQAPQLQSGLWYPRQGLLCPLQTGACLCDFNLPSPESSILLKQVAYPLLLLPYLATIALQGHGTAEIYWPGTQMRCCGKKFHGLATDRLNSTLEVSVQCGLLPQSLSGQEPSYQGQAVDEKTWQILETFAHQTYVPASEVSRQGAGPAN